MRRASAILSESDAVRQVSTAKSKREVQRLVEDICFKRKPAPRKLWSYNTLIAACGRFGLSDLAKKVFHKALPAAGLTPNGHSLSAYANTVERWEEALELLDHQNSSSPYVTNAVLKCLRKADRPREALSVLAKYETDATSFTIACGVVDADAAYSFLKQCRYPDDRLYAAVISRQTDRDRAVDIFEKMPSRCRSDRVSSAVISSASAEDAVRIYSTSSKSDYCKTAVISSCGRDGQWRRALSFVDADCSEIVARAAISACERGACDAAAIAAAKILKHLRVRSGGKLQLSTVNAAISALGAGGRTSAALVVFNELRSPSNSICVSGPDAISYSAAISACSKDARWRDALLLLAEMRLTRVRISSAALGAALVACQRARGAGSQAASVLRAARRRKLPIDTSCYDAAILAQLSAKDWKTAIALFRECRGSSKLEPATRTYLALIEVLHAAKQPQRADIVYQAARSRNRLSHDHVEGVNTVDLHEYSKAAAACAVRAALREADPEKDLQIVVGRGRHSSGEDVLPAFVGATLAAEHQLPDCHPLPNNPGRILVSSASLKQWRASSSSIVSPAAWRLATGNPLLAHPALLLSRASAAIGDLEEEEEEEVEFDETGDFAGHMTTLASSELEYD